MGQVDEAIWKSKEKATKHSKVNIDVLGELFWVAWLKSIVCTGLILLLIQSAVALIKC